MLPDRSIDCDRSGRSVIGVAIGPSADYGEDGEGNEVGRKRKENTRKFIGTGRNLQDIVVVVSCATVVGNSTQEKLRREFRPVMNPLNPGRVALMTV